MSETSTRKIDVQTGPDHVSATGRTRMNLAVHHMMGAALFAKHAGEIEANHRGEQLGEFFSEITWNVSATIFLSVAAIEGHINEIFLEANVYFSEHDDQEIAKLWERIERYEILYKYQEALQLNNKAKMPKSDTIYQNMDSLIKARNALVHFQPQWHDEEKSHRKIQERLKGKFEPSPFMDSGASFFPNKCMSHSFASWAVHTAMKFADEFSEKSGIMNKFIKFESLSYKF